MGATSYPGMTQPFSMSHSSNMGSVGVRQDSMGKCCKYTKSIIKRNMKKKKRLPQIKMVVAIQLNCGFLC